MFSFRTGTVLCNDFCSSLSLTLKGDSLKARGQHQALHLCICAHIPHLGMVVISGGRQPLSSNSASQNGKQVFSITASPQADLEVCWSTSQCSFCARVQVSFPKVYTSHEQTHGYLPRRK